MATYTVADAKGIKESESGKALLVEAPEFDGEEWVPYSQINDDSEVFEPYHEGDLVVSEWFARKRGWV